MSSPASTPAAAASAPKALPPVRRYITTHDADGKSVWDETSPAEAPSQDFGGFTFHANYHSTTAPHDCAGNADVARYRADPLSSDVAPAAGSIFRIVDILPGNPAYLHRTASLDYAVVLEGEVDCVLDGGAARTLRRGDVLVQRGTMHGWVNRGPETARVCFTMLAARPVTVGGRELPVHGLGDMDKLETL